jgi:hypothetical protein
MPTEKKSDANLPFNQSKDDLEDLKFKLDAILTALILPRLGTNKREITKRISKEVKSELGRNIWNSINGERTLADIGKKVKRKPQVVLNYIKRWEQESPPIVYVSRTRENSKIYRRIFEINLRKEEIETEPEPQPQQPPSEQSNQPTPENYRMRTRSPEGNLR